MDGVIDFHVHLPWFIRDPVAAAGFLVGEMDRAGVARAVVIAVETSVGKFTESIDRRGVVEALGESMYLFFPSVPGYLNRLIEDLDSALKEHVDLLKEHRRSSLDVVKASEVYRDRLYPVASFDPDTSIEGNIEALRSLEGKIIGLKLLPTIHFTRPDKRGLFRLYKVLEDMGLILIVHTGCDPGVWELPRFCEHARPRYLAKIAKRFRDLVMVVAHMGSYSALKPGIFMDEAIDLYSRFDNVYVDTSAVDPFIIEFFVERVGDTSRILFGSDYPYVVGLTISDAVELIQSLRLTDSIIRGILRDNALKLLKNINLK